MARDENGQLVGGLNRRAWSDNLEYLEAQALLKGVNLAIESGWEKIEVETNSLKVWSKFTGRRAIGD